MRKNVRAETPDKKYVPFALIIITYEVFYITNIIINRGKTRTLERIRTPKLLEGARHWRLQLTVNAAASSVHMNII